MTEEKPKAEVLHYGLTMGGEVILQNDCLIVKGGKEIQAHWYSSPVKTDDFFKSVPLEKIEHVLAINNRKEEMYRKFCEKLKLNYKKGLR